MVLTENEYSQCLASSNGKIASFFLVRTTTSSFIEQCCADREIQVILDHKKSVAYYFNCKVVHECHHFLQFPPFENGGWISKSRGPANSELMALWTKIRRNADLNEKKREENETRTASPEREDEKSSCGFFSFLMSIFD